MKFIPSLLMALAGLCTFGAVGKIPAAAAASKELAKSENILCEPRVRNLILPLRWDGQALVYADESSHGRWPFRGKNKAQRLRLLQGFQSV